MLSKWDLKYSHLDQYSVRRSSSPATRVPNQTPRLQQIIPMSSEQLHTFSPPPVNTLRMLRYLDSHLLHSLLYFSGSMDEIITPSMPRRSLMPEMPLQTSQWQLALLLRAMKSWTNKCDGADCLTRSSCQDAKKKKKDILFHKHLEKWARRLQHYVLVLCLFENRKGNDV